MAPTTRRRLLYALGAALLGAVLGVFLLGREPSSRAAAPRAPAALGLARAPASSLPSAVPSAAASPSASSVAQKSERLVIVAGGDVNLGRECGQAILADPHYDPFEHVAPLFRDADVRFANLESQLSDQKGQTQSPYNRLIFTGPPGGGATLAQAGFNVVSTANNHAWDYGKSALFQTLDNLERAAVRSAGTGRNLEQAYAPVVVQVGARQVALFAVTQVWNDPPFDAHEGRSYVAWARQPKILDMLEQARKKYDIVLLSFHGGAEYQDVPAPPVMSFVRAIMKRGLADAVIGHHPHVPEGIGWFSGRPVFYSLGNFVFAGHDWAPWTNVGLVARLELEPGRPTRAWACPVGLDGHVPKPILPGDPRSAKARAHLLTISESTGGSEVGEPDARGCFPLRPPSEPAL